MGLAVILADAVLTIPTVVSYRRELIEQQERMLRFVAPSLVAAWLRDPGEGPDLGRLDKALCGLVDEGCCLDTVRLRLFDEEGRLIAGTEATPGITGFVRDVLEGGVAIPRGGEERGWTTVAMVARPDQGGAIGVLHLAVPHTDVDRHLALRAGRTILLSSIALLVVGLITLGLLHGSFFKPMDRLLEADRAVLAGDDEHAFIHDRQIPDNEMGELMRSRNALLGKLRAYEKSIREQNQILEAQLTWLKRRGFNLEVQMDQKARILLKAQETLLQTEKLAAIGKLAAGVAHEINNPLASVAGYAEHLQELVQENGWDRLEGFDEVPRSLKVIEEQAYRCKQSLEKLLNFARKTELSVEPFDLNRLIAESIELVGPRARRSRIEIHQHLDRDLPLLESDRQHLQQVVFNLLDNAVDAIGEAGRIDVATARRNGHVEVAVRDTGCGIKEEHRSRIFDPFFTTKPVGRGTGMGLSICYGIVTRLGGELDFESEEGKGSSFRVVLPLRCDAPENPGKLSGEIA